MTTTMSPACPFDQWYCTPRCGGAAQAAALVLSIIDENDENGDDDHVPSMIVTVKDVVGAP